jgi:hypothetical protein
MGMFDRFKKKTAEEIKPKKSGGHGDHWQIISESDKELQSYVFGAVKDGETVESFKQKNKEVKSFFSQGEVLKTCTITVNSQIWTAYPSVTDGIVHEITIESIEEWMNEQEAQIHCSLGDASLAFFDTMYFKNKGIYEPEKNITFHYPR